MQSSSRTMHVNAISLCRMHVVYAHNTGKEHHEDNHEVHAWGIVSTNPTQVQRTKLRHRSAI